MRSWAAIFDWDGVIVDSSGYHEESWRLLAAEEGRALPEGFFKRGFGKRNEQFIPGVLGWADEPAEVKRLADRKEDLCALKAAGLPQCFRAIVAADDVTRGKPDPEVFLLAADRLGAQPARCVVFEDTHFGIQAARAAGMKVVGVAGTHEPASLAGADRVVRRLDELAVGEIDAWFDAAAGG